MQPLVRPVAEGVIGLRRFHLAGEVQIVPGGEIDIAFIRVDGGDGAQDEGLRGIVDDKAGKLHVPALLEVGDAVGGFHQQTGVIPQDAEVLAADEAEHPL